MRCRDRGRPIRARSSTIRRATEPPTAHDNAHTLTASADFLKLSPKTDIRFAYDYSRAESVYV